MKTFNIDNKDYTVKTCTAIAEADNFQEDCRQDAILVEFQEEYGLFQWLIFNVSIDDVETAEDLERILIEECVASLQEELDTVKF